MCEYVCARGCLFVCLQLCIHLDWSNFFARSYKIKRCKNSFFQDSSLLLFMGKQADLRAQLKAAGLIQNGLSLSELEAATAELSRQIAAGAPPPIGASWCPLAKTFWINSNSSLGHALAGSHAEEPAPDTVKRRRQNAAGPGLERERDFATSAVAPKKLLLQLRRPHYDAIIDGRKLWEARPISDVEKKGKGDRESDFSKKATIGRVVILQSGANTNNRMLIAEVRRYIRNDARSNSPLMDMVVELGADLLPDAADAYARAEVYESLYGRARCSCGFVAMRLKLETGAPASSTSSAQCASLMPCAEAPPAFPTNERDATRAIQKKPGSASDLLELPDVESAATDVVKQKH